MNIARRDGTPRRSPGRALLLFGVALATTAGAATCRSQPADDFSAPAVTTPVSPSASVTATRVPITDGTIPAAAGADLPARLRIPAIDLDAAIDAVGVEAATGDFAVPPSVDRVGWYRYGPGFSADAGSIVIAGHVDSAAEGRGAFFRLGSLDAGDTVTLTGAGGKAREFEVVARERYRKTAIPLQRYFARDGAVRLTLITCGGPFDPKTRHYRDNVVVTAALRP
jgi:hypothetical protein